MKYPVSWLKEFVDITIPIQDLADKLSLSGLEVEAIDEINPDICNIVVGKIEKIEKHPNADKLNVTWVTDGKDTHQIVCGAKNIYEGAIVPVSLPGAKLPGGLVIKKAKLRDVESCGMICSESELGVKETSEGIWLLPQDTPIGVNFIEYATLKDTLLEIKVLPNRGDCQSIYGLAREISVLLNTQLKQPNTSVTLSDLPISQKITVDTPSTCPLYTARNIQFDAMPDTPIWMARRLNLCGNRSINLMVDITNYVLLELGQPLHTFDAKTLNALTITHAANTDTMSALDGNTYSLNSSMMVIKDTNGVQAIAGVMGAKPSETTQDSTEIVLEAAYFDAVSVRKTASALALRTESAIRFEKGVTIDAVETASNRASHLIQQLAHAKVGPLSCQKSETDMRFAQKTIPFSAQAINALLGTTFAEQDMMRVLNALEITIDTQNAIIPSHRRHDLQELPCLAEEIARLIGYDHIPSILPPTPLAQHKDSPLTTLQNTLGPIFKSNGFNETINFTMISPSDIQKCNLSTQDLQEIANPISIEESIMRPSLLPSLLKVAAHNLNRQQNSIKIYEIGSQWTGKTQESYLAALTIGQTFDTPYVSHLKTVTQSNFLTLKGIVETTLAAAGFTPQFMPSTETYLHPVLQLKISINSVIIGEFGHIHPNTAKRYDITDQTGYISLNLSKLSQQNTQTKRYQDLSKFPSTSRDVAILAPLTLPYEAIKTQIDTLLPSQVTQYHLFDLFESEEKLGKDNKSVAISFTYQAVDRNLTDEEVNHAHVTLCQALTQALPITIRDH